ncbi:membrane protein [Gordonia phage OlgasClover]|nr:membrane protein [Gordonia phage OlgasClover]
MQEIVIPIVIALIIAAIYMAAPKIAGYKTK